jgi:hypothetical protein
MNEPTLRARVDLYCPALRRALIKVRPEYFQWSPDRQERYAVTTPEADAVMLNVALIKELFGHTASSRDAGVACVDSLSRAELAVWNEVLLPYRGIGEDCFYWDELLLEGIAILDFPSLRAFDETYWRFQGNLSGICDLDLAGKPYRGSFYLDAAQLRIAGRCRRVRLSMAAGYLYAALADASRELLEARIPYRYAPGKHHGKVKGRFWPWDMRVSAGGQEAVLEELQQRMWAYERDRLDALLTSWDAAGRACVYRLDESERSDPSAHFVFADKEALAAVRFRAFNRDTREIEGPANELKAAVEAEKALMARFIDEQHAEITRTHDPKISRFRERGNVLVSV